MMYFLLSIFFVSLISIVFMMGRKLVFLNQEQIVKHQEIPFELPYLKEIKHITVKSAKKHGYNLIVTIIRFYVKGINNIKIKYGKVKNKIINKKNDTEIEKKEISKFLRIIAEYKQKIREIKHKIKKEEKL